MKLTKNFCFGENAGRNLTTGHHNILIGKDAGKELTTESFLFMIGGITYNIKDEKEYNNLALKITELIAFGLS